MTQEEDIDRAARRLLEGGMVAFPTETVYGLGGDAENAGAVARIYQAKGRPSNHPVIVHVAPEADLGHWARDIPPVAQALLRAWWPGPLTLILRRADHIPADVSGGQDTIGLRCPSHPVAQALLRRFAQLKGGQGGVAAPSANKFGQVSPTRAEHVRNEFPELDEAALLVLEGGASEVGIESTILDLSRLDQGIGAVLLRPGHISAQALAEVLGTMPARPDAAAPRVSGSLKAHYAPRTPLVVVARRELDAVLNEAAQRGESLAVAMFPPLPAATGEPGDGAAECVSSGAEPGPAREGWTWRTCARDPVEYARQLYALLRELDEGGHDRIVLEQPPVGPAWQAVNDRLGRAAAAFGG